MNEFAGSILSCFLGYDGGPSEGAIKLQPEKNTISTIPEEPVSPSIPLDDEEEPRGLTKLQKKISRRFSDYFSQRVPRPEPPLNQPAVPMAIPNAEGGRSFSRTSRANGSAYGYNGGFRSRLASNVNFNPRSGSLSTLTMRRRRSTFDNTRDPPTEGSDLNFAQRLLLANENAVTNIADLWVASAMNVDNEFPFEVDSDIEDGDTNSFDLGVPMTRTETITSDNDASLPGPPPFGYRTSRLPPHISDSFSPRTINSLQSSSLRQSSSVSHRPSVSFLATPRRPSTNTVPSIFAHPGVKTPTAVLDAQLLLDSTIEQPPTDSLQPIAESRQVSQVDVEILAEKPPSLMSQLPIFVIIQYGVMALHNTTHDQIFMSYLVS